MPMGGYVCERCYETFTTTDALFKHICLKRPIMRASVKQRATQYALFQEWLKTRDTEKNTSHEEGDAAQAEHRDIS
jgi:hypothetical protein